MIMPRFDTEARIAAAAFRLLGREAWNGLTLASVARSAKVPWDEMLKTAPSRTALVGVMLRRAAADTAKRHRPDRVAKRMRDRVFDAIMSWFEAQNVRKEAVRALYDGLAREPLTLLALRGDIIASTGWLLALAEADAGAAAPVRAACIAGIVARALPVWLSDDKDMGKTMAQLDRDLRRVERFLWPPEKPRPQTHRKSRSR
jgi:AcrR family transcriptional regulator